MPDKYPYVTTQSGLTQSLDHLKSSFPATFNADTMKKLGLAPNNEGTVLNVIRFLGLINDSNMRTDIGQRTFTLHDEGEFQKAFSELIQKAYQGLFELHGEAAWTLEEERLIIFFRQNDQSTQNVGRLQARTFKTLAVYAGHSAEPPPPSGKTSPRTISSRKQKKTSTAQKSSTPGESASAGEQVHDSKKLYRDFGLTVRIEINLPTTGDQETYDKIFRSIRENLLDG
jgi:hypothetical protein